MFKMSSTRKVIYIFLVIKVIFLLNCECQNLNIFSNTTCQNDRFNCSNGQLILCSEVCDGRKNCADSSDETFLACRNVYCTDDQFRCSYGGCISSSLECNGVQDCVDNSDEISLNCPGVLSALTRNKNCSFGFFQCKDQTCIREEEVCDGKLDCGFLNSDETEEQCSNHYCSEENFRCNYGACILSDYVCDGVKNCFDGSDEHDQCSKMISSSAGTNYSDLLGIRLEDDEKFVGAVPSKRPTHPPPEYNPPTTTKRPVVLSPSSERDLLNVYRSTILKILQDLNQIEQNILRTVQTQDSDSALLEGTSQIHPNLESDFILPAPARSSSSSPITLSSQPTKNDDLEENNEKLFRSGFGERTNENVNEGDCYLDHREDLIYLDQHGTPIYGQSVPDGASIGYKCPSIWAIKRLTSNSNVCFKGRFFYDHPNCTVYCSSVSLNSLSVQASCRTQTGETIPCTGLLPVGTVAILTCKVGYKKPDTVVNDAVTCSETGEWDPFLFKCQQVCGIIQDAEATIIGGFKTNITQVPWHASIYEARPGKVEQICGGSIINPTAIVTAAHCFWNSQKQEVYPAARYRVIVGKTLREYSSEPLTQMFKVKTIDTYDQYQDYNGLFVADIAVLVLEKPIIFAPHIKPICIEYSLKNNERYVASGLTGRVAGFGLTSSGGEPSSVLKVIDLPTVDYNTCIKVSPPDFVLFVTSDKFCGGFTTGESVCVGDSGGAFALARPVGNNQVYFLRGIVSTGPRLENSCDNNKYSAFTDVQLNIVFLYKYISSTN